MTIITKRNANGVAFVPHVPVSTGCNRAQLRNFGGTDIVRRCATTTTAWKARTRRGALRMVSTDAEAKVRRSPYEEKYVVSDLVQSSTQRYSDSRMRAWTYPIDLLLPASSVAAESVVICLHTSSGLGVNKTYWDRLFNQVAAGECEKIAYARFDWVGTGRSEPKPDYVDKPYDTDFFSHQLLHVVHALKSMDGLQSVTKVVLLAQGASEPMALRAITNGGSLISGLVIATGLSTRAIGVKNKAARMGLAYSVLKGPLGEIFWASVRKRGYLTNFSLKNLLSSEAHLTQWVDAAMEGSEDKRIRFNVFSFLAGYHFDDYKEEMERVKQKCMYLAGVNRSDVSLKVKAATVRAPVPILARESDLRDDAIKRMRYRQNVFQNCTGVVVDGAGFEMFFEQPELALPHLVDFVQQL